jgi:hypothetical protein
MSLLTSWLSFKALAASSFSRILPELLLRTSKISASASLKSIAC